MSTTAATSPPKPSPQATQSAHGREPAKNAAAHGQAPTDLFSSLLASLADGGALDSGAAAAGETGLLPEDPQDPQAGDNPLALLMAWTAPRDIDSALASAPGTATLAGETRGLDTRAERQAGAAADGAAAPAAGKGARTATAAWHASMGRAPALGDGLSQGLSSAKPNGAASGETPALHWSRAAAPADAGAAAASVRSTVALDARFQASAPAASALALMGSPAARGAEAEQPLPGASPLGGARAIGEAAATLVAGASTTADAGLGGDGPSEGGGQAFAESGSEQNPNDPYAAPADAEAVQVQHWGAGAMRHASLRVGEDAQRAIDIELAVRGGEVQLDIRSDDAATRELLREQAQASLGERLQQGGLSLGSVSVGEQGQGGAGERREAASQAQAARAARAEAPTPTPAPEHAATDGSSGGVDLFI